ncbi:MAG: penicillin acylase family protein, partial [bacterium]|nr:penicillin acylase family protein [bacterium]
MKVKTWSLAKGIFTLLFCAVLSACFLPEVERFDPVTGTLDGMGVSAEVKVVRDANGVVHVEAATDEDLFFAVGYAMAQDRFTFMDLYRRAGSGRLSELLGSPASFKGIDLPHMDVALRTFGFVEAAEKGVADLDPESRAQLEAFTRGVNRYLADGGDTIAFYSGMNLKPAPWTIEDCFLVSGISGLTMTVSSFFEEYYLERIRRAHGDAVRDLFVPVHGDDETIITRDELLSSFTPSSIIPPPLGKPGSNNWAVAGSRTVSGKPIIANDPHVPSSIIPTYWWHVHMKSPGYDVMGLMFPGSPCFGAATNGKISWVLTNVMADYVDLWRERVNPNDPDEYLVDGQWLRFEERAGVVNVRGKKPVRYTMRSSKHGVVIDSELLGWKIPTAENEVLALRYVDMDFARFYRGYQAMARAGNFEEWLAGVKDESWGPFAWNHTYADVEGRIAYWASGHFPVRPDNQGYIARRGWESAQDWRGYVAFEDNPHLVNPNKAYIATANNRVEVPGYPHYITVDYSSPSRATIISERIEAKPKLDVDDMKAIQYNVEVWSARKMVPLILADLAGTKDKTLKE